MSVKRVAIIVPAFNEEKSLESLLPELKSLSTEGFEYTFVVVNDGSSDNTADVVKKNKIVLLDLPVNLGIGGAVQAGYKFAYENGFDVAMQVDGDGQHPPSQIPTILDGLQDADVVIGSRFLGTGQWRTSAARRVGIRFLNYQLRLLCGVRITDCTSGFRALNSKALAVANEYYPDEYPEPESIIVFNALGLQVKEVPVEMRSRTQGRSSIRALLPIYYMLKVSLAMMFTWFRTKSYRHG